MRRASLFVLGLALAACTANIPDDRYRCAAETDCPSGFVCNANGHCYRAASSPDGGISDAVDATDAFVGPDTGPCIGSDCVTLVVTNAFGASLAGGSFTVGMTTATMPDFGGTTAELSVELGADHMLHVSYGTESMTYAATAGMRYAVVLGPAAGSDVPTVRVLPNSFTTMSGDIYRMHVVDMSEGGATYSLHVNTQINPLGRTMDADALVFSSIVRDPLEVHVTVGGGDVLLAAFDSDDMPHDRDYYVVLVGRPDAHLASSVGLRAIPVVPGGSLVGSAPLVYVLNTTTEALWMCAGTTSLAMIPPGELLQGVPGVAAGAPAGGPRVLTFHGLEDCMGTHGVDGGIPWRSTTQPIVGRVLLALVGDVVGGMWASGAAPEAPPNTESGVTQVITYGNGTNRTLRFGEVLGTYPATAGGPGVTYHAWTTTPATLAVDFGAAPAMRLFDWMPNEATAAVLVTTDGTVANTFAYEMGTTFGQAWTLSPVSPTP